MLRFRLPVLVVTAVVAVVLLAIPAGALPANVDVSQRHLNESEEAIAVNPTNPNNIVVFTNVGHTEAGLTAGMFLGVSFDGGKTWSRRLVGLGAGDPLGDTCCDPSLSFDRYGNLFMTYLYQVEDQVPIALSTDGGLSFNVIANISEANLPAKKARGDNRACSVSSTSPPSSPATRSGWCLTRCPLVATGAPVTGSARSAPSSRLRWS
jgi:hypothetical protein